MSVSFLCKHNGKLLTKTALKTTTFLVFFCTWILFYFIISSFWLCNFQFLQNCEHCLFCCFTHYFVCFPGNEYFLSIYTVSGSWRQNSDCTFLLGRRGIRQLTLKQQWNWPEIISLWFIDQGHFTWPSHLPNQDWAEVKPRRANLLPQCLVRLFVITNVLECVGFWVWMTLKIMELWPGVSASRIGPRGRERK